MEEKFQVSEEMIKSILVAPYELRELINDINNGDISRNDLCDSLSAVANNLERNSKFLRNFFV